MMYYDLSADTESYASSPVSHAVASGRNDTRLEGQTWAQPQGIAANQTNFSRKETKELNALARTQKMGPDAADRAKLFTVSEKTPNHGLAVFPDSVKYNPDENLFSMEVRNEYLRQLGSYVEFYSDTQMEQPIESPEINGQWPFYFPDGLRQLFETNTERAIGTVPAINTIMGIPMPTDPTNLEVPWPKEAQAARLMFGGLGTSNWISPVVWPGVILTGMFNIGLPIAFMIAGAALTNTQWYKDFVSSRDNVMAVIGVAFPIVGAGVATGAALGNTKKVLFSFANTFIGMLAKKGFEKLASYVMKKVAASAIKNALPIVGFAFRLASIAMSGAQLAVTIGEILSTPAVLEVDVLRQMELDFTLHPDPEHGEPGRPETAIWPLVGEQVQVTVTYVNGTSYVQNQTLPKTSTNDPLIFRFKPIGWGGKFTVTANVYSRNGWLCGKYVSKELDAEPDSKTPGVKAISGTIKEQLVPLTGDTQYYYKQSLEFDGSKHLWAAGKVSTATLSDLNCSNADHYLCELVSMTVNQKAYQAGYVFRASGQGIPNENSKGKPDNGQIYAIQNISLLSTETLNERLKFSEEGFLVKPGIAYDTFGVGPSADKISPLNFILDSRGGTYRLRHVDLMNFKHDFGLTKPQRKSWGQFLIPDIDELAIHPSGLAIAISYQASKMQILQLPPEPLPDGQEPQAQIVSGYGVLQGLMRGPIAAKVSVDGAIYILESIGRRIQAFDTKGNPVPTFQGASLFTMEGPGFAASLNDEKFSPEIRDVFMSKGVGHLFDFRDPSFAAILNQGKLTMDVVNTMAAHGIYLSFNEDANGIIPEGSTTVTVDEPDVMWTLHDPQKNFTYEIKTINGQTDEFSVSDLLSNVTVDAIGRDTRWVVNDLAGTQSFLLLGVPDTPLIKVYEYLSYFDLKGDDSTRYVDFALEAKGYIYVLSYQNDGGARVPHTAYSLDIHKPNGEFLVRTPDPKLHADPEKMEFVAAARLVLDPFRNVFTLDYSSFQGPNGRTEPGVSTWIPTTPLFDDEPAKMLLFETKDIPGLVHLFKKHGVTISPDSTVEIVNPDGDFLLHSGGDTYNAIIS
ncbi:hypothetical protein [Pseudovibrio denitrificans]|nr:hypothetical protein [Pseudovibrio denitrificans]